MIHLPWPGIRPLLSASRVFVTVAFCSRFEWPLLPLSSFGFKRAMAGEGRARLCAAYQYPRSTKGVMGCGYSRKACPFGAHTCLTCGKMVPTPTSEASWLGQASSCTAFATVGLLRRRRPRPFPYWGLLNFTFDYASARNPLRLSLESPQTHLHAWHVVPW